MRLKITLNPKNELIPFQYKNYVQGLIYSCLDEETGNYLHNEGVSFENKIFKMFVFSDFIGSYRIVKGKLSFNHHICFFIASLDEIVISQIYHNLIQRSSIQLGNNSLDVVKVEYNDDNDYEEINTYTMSTISPIICCTTDENHFTTYHDPRSQIFKELIEKNLSEKYIALFNDYSENDVFEILEVQRIKPLMYRYKSNNYRCYHMQFTLRATENYLLIALNTGLGSKNGAGFGMVEIK